MSQLVLVDAGPLVALRHENDVDHRRCVDAMKSPPAPLLTCWPVLTEAAYLLRRHPTQVRELLAAADGGLLEILSLTNTDIAAINAILKKYEDQHFQLADASLMWLSQRENVDCVFIQVGPMQTKRRHFNIVELLRRAMT